MGRAREDAAARRRRAGAAAHVLPARPRRDAGPRRRLSRRHAPLPRALLRGDRRVSVHRVLDRRGPVADGLRHAHAHLPRRRRGEAAVHPRDLPRPRGAAQLVGQRRPRRLRAGQLVRGPDDVHGRLRVQGARVGRGRPRRAPRLAARLRRGARRRAAVARVVSLAHARRRRRGRLRQGGDGVRDAEGRDRRRRVPARHPRVLGGRTGSAPPDGATCGRPSSRLRAGRCRRSSRSGSSAPAGPRCASPA